jgi:hypothetical protein
MLGTRVMHGPLREPAPVSILDGIARERCVIVPIAQFFIDTPEGRV